MPITIPNIEKVRPTTNPISSFPNAMKVAAKNPCPVKVSTSGASSSGIPLVEPTVDNTGVGYAGFNIQSDMPVGASSDDVQMSVVSGCIVEGFAGVVPGTAVYIDPTARPDPETTFSGLTHTNTGGVSLPIGFGCTTTKIRFLPR